MSDNSDFVVDTAKTTLYTEVAASPDRLAFTFTRNTAAELSDTITTTEWNAFLSELFDALDVSDRENWTPPETFIRKHPAIDDHDELRFQRRCEDAYQELRKRGSEHVVVKFTQQTVSVGLRQAAPDDIHAETREELLGWEQACVGETFDWVDGVFTVVSVDTELKIRDARKTSRRVFTLEYTDGHTETMPVSIHKLYADAGHITNQ